ncbi:hypothetical protein J4E90_001207 [Alternaria incomplexa]|uniref:uncharacterized protein n=1 Tax=Alternaria incomplexa TaxID=1187928 RepID=UPI00221FBF1A|nr:uncharacterized protein J4E90_001207 [Alternaria incomplexa]KAI4922773.1 hypothetical protein J4E90_001207 [Alternaria incomplexa]
MSIAPPSPPCSAKHNENNAPSCETPGPSSPVASSTLPDSSDESPIRESPSMRKGLMGSLRKQKLRSIGSLRSLRSPTKTKQSDTSEYLIDSSPLTPKHRLNSSLLLYFEESPPDRPIFDLDRMDSRTSSLYVHHSSPVPVPSPYEQIPQSPADSSLILDGTVPPSPAPIQKILDSEKTMVRSSPAYTHGLREAAVYFNEPLVRFPNPGSEYLPIDDCFSLPAKSEDLGQTSAREDPSGVDHVDNSPVYNKPDKPSEDATTEVSNATNTDRTPEEHAQLILEKGYQACVYRRADGECRLKINLLAFCHEDDDDCEWNIKTQIRFAAAEEEKLASQLSAIIRNVGLTSMSDSELDEAFATGKLPANLDVDPSWQVVEEVNMGKRDSSWGEHTGLYDGSGYGSSSSSRPVTGVTETADVPHTRIPGAFVDHENEAPMIIRRLWDNTYPHSPDTDSPVKATVADPAISAAQEQHNNPLQDYEAFQGMLDLGGSA